MTAGSVQRDQNRIPALWGVSSVDGVSLVPIQILSGGSVRVDYGTSTSAVMNNIPTTIPRDENRVTALAGATSTGTIIPVSVDPTTGAILATYS